MQPRRISIVSVEKGVWEILADGQRVGGVLGSLPTVYKASRLVSRKTGCKFVYEETYAPMTDMFLTVIQFEMVEERVSDCHPRWTESVTHELDFNPVI